MLWSNHQTLTGLLDLIHKYEINPDDINTVEHIGPGVPGLGALIRSEVGEGLEGKFCLEYNIGAAIIDKKVDLNTFTDARSDEGDIQEFMKKVTRSQNPDVSLRHTHIEDGDPSARIRIKMKNGQDHDVELGVAHHLTGSEVTDKFKITAGHIFGDSEINQVIDIVGSLETLDSARTLMDIVTL